MKKGLLFCLLVGTVGLTYAQFQYSRNVFYVEGMGQGGLYALNYERHFRLDESLYLAARVGAAPSPLSFNTPVGINLLWGETAHRLEGGIGMTFLYRSVISQGSLILHYFERVEGSVKALYLGYRYQSPQGGFLFRIGYQPLFADASLQNGLGEQGFSHWMGISLGLALRQHTQKVLDD